MQGWKSFAVWLVTAVGSAIVFSFVFGTWYAVYAMSKLGAVLEPGISQDSSGGITVDAAVPQPLISAVIVAGLAMLVLWMVIRVLPRRAASSIAPTAVLVGSLAAWLPAAAQFASDRWHWPAYSLNWMGVSGPGEFLAASVVALVPGLFAFMLLRSSVDQ